MVSGIIIVGWFVQFERTEARLAVTSHADRIFFCTMHGHSFRNYLNMTTPPYDESADIDNGAELEGLLAVLLQDPDKEEIVSEIGGALNFPPRSQFRPNQLLRTCSSSIYLWRRLDQGLESTRER